MSAITFIVTGCAGFIGANLCAHLIRTRPSDRVVGIDNESSGSAANVCVGVEYHKLDLTTDLVQVEAVIARECAQCPRVVLFHFAAYAAECLSPFLRRYNVTQNWLATTHLITLAIKYRIARFVFASSAAVYGTAPSQCTEDTPPKPADPYGIAKLACEMDLRVALEQHGLEHCIVRCHNVYGPMQSLEDTYRNVLGIFMYQAKCGLPLTVYGDGTQTRCFTYIDDILEPLVAAALTDDACNQTINLGGATPTSVRRIVDLVAAAASCNRIEHVPARHEVQHVHVSADKCAALLGFVESTSIQAGIQAMWHWARTQPVKPRQQWDALELDVALPTVWKGP